MVFPNAPTAYPDSSQLYEALLEGCPILVLSSSPGVAVDGVVLGCFSRSTAVPVLRVFFGSRTYSGFLVGGRRWDSFQHPHVLVEALVL
jgi:hypothetical protein